MECRGRDKIFFLFTVAFWLMLLINNYIWLNIDYCPFTYDAHRQFIFSLKVFEEYQNLSIASVSNIIKMTQRHPPFVAAITAPFYFLFGIAQDTGTMINASIFLFILLIAVYLIGKRIMGPKAGLLSVFIVAMYPIIFNHMKTYTLDLPLTAMVALGMLFLLLSENFTKLRYSLLFGLSCGLGFLTKDGFPLYIIAPFIVSVIQGIRGQNIDGNRRKILMWLGNSKRNLFFLLSIVFLISIPYYIEKHQLILAKLGLWHCGSYFTFYISPGELPYSSLFLGPLFKRMKSLIWYFWGFINWQVSFFSVAIFIISLCFFIKLKFKDKWVLLSGLLAFIFIAFTRGAYGEHMAWIGVRFTMPILPVIAIISAIGILSIPQRIPRVILISSIIIIGLLQFGVINYGAKILPEQIVIPLERKVPSSIRKYYLFPEELILFKQEWPAYGGPLSQPNAEMPEKIRVPEEIFKIIDSSNKTGRPINILVIPDISRIWAFLEYNAYVKNRPYQILGDWIYFASGHTQAKEFIGPNLDISGEKIILNSDYVIDKMAGELGENYLLSYVKHFHKKFEKFKDRFELIKKIKWPDETDIFIYKRK